MSSVRRSSVALWLAALAGAALPLHAQEPGGPLVVFNAGSLAYPFKALLDGFSRDHPGVHPMQESSGSLEAARKLTELGKVPDVLGVADYGVIAKLLMPAHATWYVTFASNAMVLAYSDHSVGAKEITAENWWRILLRPAVRWGASNPALDPNGYRTRMVFQLAEAHYEQPGLARRLLQALRPELVRPAEAQLIALVQSGELDYAWSYRSLARTAGLKWVELPREVDLSDPALADWYRQARVRPPGAGVRPVRLLTGGAGDPGNGGVPPPAQAGVHRRRAGGVEVTGLSFFPCDRQPTTDNVVSRHARFFQHPGGQERAGPLLRPRHSRTRRPQGGAQATERHGHRNPRDRQRQVRRHRRHGERGGAAPARPPARRGPPGGPARRRRRDPGRAAGEPGMGELAVRGPRGRLPARGGAAGGPMAAAAQRGHHAGAEQDRVPGGDRQRLRGHRFLALQRAVRRAGVRRAAAVLAGGVEPAGAPAARGLRLRHHAVQLHRHRRQSPHRARAHGEHGGVEARVVGGAQQLFPDGAAPGGGAPAGRDQLRPRSRAPGHRAGAGRSGARGDPLHRLDRGLPVALEGRGRAAGELHHVSQAGGRDRRQGLHRGPSERRSGRARRGDGPRCL